MSAWPADHDIHAQHPDVVAELFLDAATDGFFAVSLPRILAIMGSGETSPTMVKTHRELFGRLGPGPSPPSCSTRPFGFQENADDIVGRAVAYFAESVGHDHRGRPLPRTRT